jgi:hypothetical protein
VMKKCPSCYAIMKETTTRTQVLEDAAEAV